MDEDVPPFSFDFDQFNPSQLPGVGPVLDTDSSAPLPFDSENTSESGGKKRKRKRGRPKRTPVLARARNSERRPAKVPSFDTGAYDYLLDRTTRHEYDDRELSQDELNSRGESEDEVEPNYVPIGVDRAFDALRDEEDVSVSEEDLSIDEEEGSRAASRMLAEEEEDDTWCFMCLYGNRRYDKVACPKANKLAELFEENFGSATSTRALSAIMYKYYRDEIYLKGVESGRRYPAWNKEGVYRHITEHMSTEPRVWTLLTIERLQKMTKMIDQFIMEEDETTGVRSINPQLINVQLRTTKLIQELYRSKVKEFVGFNETLKVDPKNVGRLWHISNISLDG